MVYEVPISTTVKDMMSERGNLTVELGKAIAAPHPGKANRLELIGFAYTLVGTMFERMRDEGKTKVKRRK